jgi:hypothetical protein
MTLKEPRRLSLSRTLSIVLALTAIGAAGVVFEEKRQASSEARDIAKLNRKIEAEKEKISELKAEWSLLDQPARLQSLVEHHADVLPLEVMKTEQIGTIDDVPWRPVEETKGDAAPPHATEPSSSPTAAMQAPAQTEHPGSWDEPETAEPADALPQAGQPVPQAAQPTPPVAPSPPQAVRAIPQAAQAAPTRNGG